MKLLIKLSLVTLLLLVQQVSAQLVSISPTVTGSGNPVLFLPGFASNASVWDVTVNQFSKTNQCHVIDYAGFGKVDPIEFPWLTTILEDLKTYIKTLDNPNLVIVGHSMGGTIATWLASQSDVKIKEIIIVDGLSCTGALMFPNFAPESMIYDSPHNQNMLTMYDTAFEQMAIGMAQGMVASSLHQLQIKESILNCDRKTYVYGFTDYLKLDVRPLLNKITVPVTILGAGKLYGVEGATQTYKNQYKNLSSYNLIVNKDAMHFIMLDAPIWFQKQLQLILV
ncbi:alpha/beta hydrolase [uncultured Nonlabens sp.]|uniref:alpha/beta fold hydrolase n=1 Tax=uncultured Nonlabens sp. TaxID=859306 RepID=UPI0026352930|nr:alpha/beta hydrolase [uncultured Nonlabens sp.]